MFSKSKINDPVETAGNTENALVPSSAAAKAKGPKPAPSIISGDLMIEGNLTTTGDIQIEGTVNGNIRSHLLTIGQTAVIKGDIIADDVVINGSVEGTVRGQKVRLSSTARMTGEIIHRTIAIEAGADFQGSVSRKEDPIGDGAPRPIGS